MTTSSTLSVRLGKAPSLPDGPSTTNVSATNLSSAISHQPSENSLTQLLISVDASELETVWTPLDLSAFGGALLPGASVEVHLYGSEKVDLQPVHTAFLLSGLAADSEAKQADGSRILRATKPAATATAVRLSIDEDGLLGDSSNLLAPPPSMSAVAAQSGDDCGGRQPCDDCTCGRADALAAEQAKTTVKTSSCGKCGMGDAFRCASCPYLGKPAFKPGEEHLVLDLQDDF